MLDFLAQPVRALNTELLLFSPGWLVIAFWSILSAVISMILYKQLSPQQKIIDLGVDIKKLQQQLISSDAPLHEISSAMKSYITLSFKKVLIVLLPSLVSALPFLLVIPGLELSFSQMEIIHFGYEWMRHWIASVVFFSLATSLLLKHFFNIH